MIRQMASARLRAVARRDSRDMSAMSAFVNLARLDCTGIVDRRLDLAGIVLHAVTQRNRRAWGAQQGGPRDRPRHCFAGLRSQRLIPDFVDARLSICVPKNGMPEINPAIDNSYYYILARVPGEVITRARPQLVGLNIRHAVVKAGMNAPLLPN